MNIKWKHIITVLTIALPKVGTFLKERYDASLEVTSDPAGINLITADDLNDNRKSYKAKSPHIADLVFLESSSDYCTYDPRTGNKHLSKFGVNNEYWSRE